jgi:5'-deoxynucleotidase YfbR-like HD superfamily hydrolase
MSLTQEILVLMKKGESLKRVNRSGWDLAGIDCIRRESVGDHSFGTIMISLLISKALAKQGFQVDLSKIVSMATLHDIPEVMISDIPRKAIELGGELFKKAKKETELKAIKSISEETELFGKWILSTWTELAERETLESRIVMGADIIDMLVHAISLESSGVSPETLNQFFVSSKGPIINLKLEIIEDIFWELYKEHIDMASNQGMKLERIN